VAWTVVMGAGGPACGGVCRPWSEMRLVRHHIRENGDQSAGRDIEYDRSVVLFRPVLNERAANPHGLSAKSLKLSAEALIGDQGYRHRRPSCSRLPAMWLEVVASGTSWPRGGWRQHHSAALRFGRDERHGECHGDYVGMLATVHDRGSPARCWSAWVWPPGCRTAIDMQELAEALHPFVGPSPPGEGPCWWCSGLVCGKTPFFTTDTAAA